MAKLTTIRTGLAPVTRTLSPVTDPYANRDQSRERNEPWRKWYRLKRWYDLRWSVLLRDLFTCQWPGCGRTHHDTSQLVAHHRVRHRGNPVLFYDPNNLMCVCRECHEGPIKALERTQGGH